MGDHGHKNIEMDLNQDWGGKGIEAEELDRFCYTIFNSPSLSVTDEDGGNRAIKIIGDQKGRLISSCALHDNLSERIVIISQLYNRFKDKGGFILLFGDIYVDFFPLAVWDQIQGG